MIFFVISTCMTLAVWVVLLKIDLILLGIGSFFYTNVLMEEYVKKKKNVMRQNIAFVISVLFGIAAITAMILK